MSHIFSCEWAQGYFRFCEPYSDLAYALEAEKVNVSVQGRAPSPQHLSHWQELAASAGCLGGAHVCFPCLHPMAAPCTLHTCIPCSARLHPTFCTPAPQGSTPRSLHACTLSSASLHPMPTWHSPHAYIPLSAPLHPMPASHTLHALHPVPCTPAWLSSLHRAGCGGFQPQPRSTALPSEAEMLTCVRKRDELS